MKIEKIEQPKHYRPGQKRCQRLVYHSGDGSTPRPSSNCCKFAKFIIDGKRYCYQHASEFVFLRSLENPAVNVESVDWLALQTEAENLFDNNYTTTDSIGIVKLRGTDNHEVVSNAVWALLRAMIVGAGAQVQQQLIKKD